MYSTITSVGGRAPPRKKLNWIQLEDRVRPLQLPDLLLEDLDPLLIHGRGPRAHPVIDVSLTHPTPNRLDPVAELSRDPLHRPMRRPQLVAQLTDEAYRLGLLLIGVPTSRRLP